MPPTKDSNPGEASSDAPTHDAAPAPPEWVVLIDAHLKRAASLAIEHGVPEDGFLRACGVVYDESDPEQRLRVQLAELREHGRIGEA